MSRRRFVKNQSKTLAVAIAALALHGCGSQEPGAVEGELLVGTTDPDEGDVQSMYYLHVPEGAGSDPELVFTRNPYLNAGTKLRVWGDRVGDHLYVKRHELVEDDFGVLQQGLIGSPKKPLTAAIAIVDLGGGSPNLTLDQAKARMFSTTSTTDGKTMSLKYFYAEQSYGVMEVNGEGFGPVPFTMSGCDYNGLGKAVNAAVGKFDKYVYYFGSKASACAWSGLGGGNQAWLNASISCVVLMQEFGHAVALPHSSTMKCGSASFADDPSTCTHSEYGGKHSPMGSGCYAMTGWEKWREGWLQSCNGVRVKSSGSYTIYPLELPCSGAQVLQIPMAHTRQAPDGLQVTLTHYYLELRGPYGIDTPLKPQVLLYAGPDPGTATRLSDQRAWVLDQSSSDTSINGWGLVVGQTFTDPAGGVSFTVESMDANQAVINVDITSTTVPNSTGDSTCIDNTVFAAGVSECATMTARPDGSVTVGGASSTGGTTSTGGTSSTGGKGGAGGTVGTAGRGGAGGAAGALGSAGRGGAGGSGGSGGNSGSSGASGSSTGGTSTGGTTGGTSTGGTTGGTTGGIPTTGGTITTGGTTGGVPTTGGVATGGTPSIPGTGVQPPVDAGCACEIGVGARPGTSSWSLAALGLSLTHLFKRRRKRAHGPSR